MQPFLDTVTKEFWFLLTVLQCMCLLKGQYVGAQVFHVQIMPETVHSEVMGEKKKKASAILGVDARNYF